MTFVIPMAGRGQRFVEAGFDLPKFLLQAHGKTLLEWSVDSLPLELADRVVFIMLREHEEQYGVAQHIRGLYGQRTRPEFVFLEEVTRGQSETVLRASGWIEPSQPLVIFNIDTMFDSPTLKANLLREDTDGVLGCFQSTEPRFSFAATDTAGRVTRVTEKEPISDHALTGLYHFRRASDFLEAATKAIETGDLTKGEYYVAPLYNHLLQRGRTLTLDHATVHYILGTPAEYAAFTTLPVDSPVLGKSNGHLPAT